MYMTWKHLPANPKIVPAALVGSTAQMQELGLNFASKFQLCFKGSTAKDIKISSEDNDFNQIGK